LRKNILSEFSIYIGINLIANYLNNKNTNKQICLFSDMPWLIVCSAMIGKLAITSSYGAIYVFTAEQFPTVIRNVGLGASSTFARIGGVIAPYVNHLVYYHIIFLSIFRYI